MPTATRTAEVKAAQTALAMAKANRVKGARAELKRALHEQTRSAADVIEQNSWEARSMTVFNLLCAQFRWGRARAVEFLAAIPMSELKTVGALTVRERRSLAARLRGEVDLYAAPWSKT